MVVGLDGCRDGWIAAILESGSTRLQVFGSLDSLFDDPRLVTAVIDVPIGLPEAGPRRCDLLARQLLRAPRASSVFPAPLRSMLAARDQREASEFRFAVERKKCSVQLAAILPKIREVDNLIDPQRQVRVREGHPEVSFAMMNGSKSMAHAKRRPAGRDERLVLLRESFPDVLTAISGAARFAEDAVDAYAMLWTATRLVQGASQTLPETPNLDRRGLRMEIVV